MTFCEAMTFRIGDRSLKWAQDIHAIGRFRIALLELELLMILVHVPETSGGIGMGSEIILWSVSYGPHATITVVVLDKSEPPRRTRRI